MEKNCGAPVGFDIVRQTYACARGHEKPIDFKINFFKILKFTGFDLHR